MAKGKGVNSMFNLIVMILKISKPLSPNSIFYLFVFFLLKFIGLIIFSAAFENMNSMSISFVLRKLTIYNDMISTRFVIQYDYFLIVLYVLLLIPIISLIIFSFNKRYCISNQIIEEELSKGVILCNKIITYLFIVIVFFSQHIIEYLCLPICLLFPSSFISNESIVANLSTAVKNLFLHPSIYIIINLIFIILLNVYIWFYFKWFNFPFITKHYLFKDNHNNLFLCLLILVFNFQGFHYYSYLNNALRITLFLIGLILSLLLMITSVIRYIEKNFFNYVIHGMILYSAYIAIITVIIHYTIDKLNDQFIWTNSIIALLILASYLFIFFIQNKHFNQCIIKNLFIKHKQSSNDYMYQMIKLLNECYVDIKNFAMILKLIQESTMKHENHNISIETSDLINLKNFSLQIKESEGIIKGLTKHRQHFNFKEKFNAILVLVETELVNFIASMVKSNSLQKHSRILLLHCDFINYFKLNHSFSLYLIHQYISRMKGSSLITKLNFYSLKNHILSEKNTMNIKENQLNKDLSIVKFSEFLNYFQVIQNIRSLLIQSSTDYHNVIGLKNFCSKVKNLKESMSNRKTIENLFHNCTTIDIALNELKRLLINNFKEYPLKNPELCYLLKNFYEIIDKSIPDEILSCISNVPTNKTVLGFASDFLDKDFEHPMILTMESQALKRKQMNKSKGDFRIYYISQKLATLLGYKTSDLLEEDCNKLIPESFAEQHTIGMKKKLFLNENMKLSRTTFVITQDGYYRNVQLSYGLMHSLTKDTLIICDINIDHQEKDRLLFITDTNTNIITMTKNVTQKFNIDFHMINRLNITISNFFSIPLEHLHKIFSNQLDSIEKQKNESVDNILNVFTTNSYPSVLKAYEGNSTTNNNTKTFSKNNHCSTQFIKKKYRIVSYLQKLKSDVEELENNDKLLHQIEALERDFKGRKDNDVFKIKIKLHKLGNMPYYYIKVYDQNENMHTKNTSSLFLSDNKYFTPTIDDNFKKNFSKLQKAPSSNCSFNNTNNSMNNSALLNDTNNQLIITYKINSHPMKDSRKPSSLILQQQNTKLILKQITKKDIMEYIDHHKKREIILALILILFMICSSILFIYNIFLKNKTIDQLEDFFDALFGMVKLKEAILETSLLILSGCFTSDGIDPNPYSGIDFTNEMLKEQLFSRSMEMFTAFTQYMVFLNNYIHYKEMIDITGLIKAPGEYTDLNYDYSIINYTSTFEKEFFYFHYTSSFIKFDEGSLSKCKVTKNFLGNGDIPKGEKATDDDIFFYFTTHNIPLVFLVVVDQIVVLSNEFLISECEKTQTTILTFNIALLVVGLMIPLISIFLIFLYKMKMSFYFKLFISRNDKTVQVEGKIAKFLSILNSYEEDYCNAFEANKEANKILDNTLIANHIDIKEQIEQISPKKKKKILAADIQTQRHKKKALQNKKEEVIENEDEESLYDQSLSMCSLRVLYFSLYLMTMSIIAYLSLIIGNIMLDNKIIQNIQLVKEMTFTYLDRTPALNEMILFYKISVLYDSPGMFDVELEDYSLYLFRCVITNITLDTNDTRYLDLGDSIMAFLYYKTSLQFKMIRFFENTNGKTLIPLRTNFSRSTEKPEGGSCEALSKAYNEHVDKELMYFAPEFITEACKSLEGGKLDKGLSLFISNFIEYVFNDYVDYIREPNKTKDYLLKQLTTKNFITTSKMMIFVYNISWKVTTIVIDQDFINLFDLSRMEEMAFQLALIVFFILSITIYTIYLFGSLKRKTDGFSITIEKIEDSLRDIIQI